MTQIVEMIGTPKHKVAATFEILPAHEYSWRWYVVGRVEGESCIYTAERTAANREAPTRLFQDGYKWERIA